MANPTKKAAKRNSSVNWRTGLLDDRASEASEEPLSVDEHIRLRAYELYMEGGGQPNDLGDWLQAERELSQGVVSDALLGEHREIEP